MSGAARVRGPVQTRTAMAHPVLDDVAALLRDCSLVTRVD